MNFEELSYQEKLDYLENELKLAESLFGEAVEAIKNTKKIFKASGILIFNSFVGLLWFDNDYSNITETRGKKEFTDRDVAAKKTLLPNGAHASYKGRRFFSPRGRVELNNGVPTISIGEKCPDSMINKIIEYMGLYEYWEIIEIRRGTFWDRKIKR